MATSGTTTADFESCLGEPHALGKHIMSMWTSWKSARQLAEQRWGEVRNYVFATSVKDTTNAFTDFSNTTHRPELYNIYNNLLVNTDFSLFPDSDWLDFLDYSQREDSKAKRKAALAYLRTKHRLSEFRKVMRKLISDWLLTGNAFAGVEYVTRYTENPFTGEQEVAYTGPVPYRISPYSIVFNPLSPSFSEAPKIVESKMSLGEIKKQLEEGSPQGYSPEVLRTMLKDRESINANMRSERDMNKLRSFYADGIGDMQRYYQSGHVLIHEFYGDIYDIETDTLLKNYVVTVADGRYVLRKEPLNTYSGFPNIFQVVWKNMPDSLWGFGPLNNLVGLQYRINHLENARADAFDQMLQPDMVFQGDPQVKRVGGAIHYYMPETGNVAQLRPDTTILNADLQIQQHKIDMQEYAGAPREAVGIRSPGEKTAFEVDTLMSAANRVFEYQTNIFSEFLEQIVNAELEEAQKNLDGSDIVSILNEEFGVEEFLRVTKQDLYSNGKVVAVGARDSARKARLSNQLSQFYQVGMQDPEVSQHFPAKKIASLWAELLGFDKLFVPYGRIPEQLEAQRQMMAAQETLQEESMIDATGLTEEDEFIE